MTAIERFRFDHAYNKVYEYSDEHSAYLFCGALNGMTEKQFIAEYEEIEDD